MRSGAVGIYGRHPVGWRTLRKVKGREQPMRQVMRKGLITVAAATGVIAVTGGYAQADAGAGSAATNSPGVLSGNSVSVPVHVPVNACGNGVDVVGLLNPAFGNSCANSGGSQAGPAERAAEAGGGQLQPGGRSHPDRRQRRLHLGRECRGRRQPARRGSSPATSSRRRSTCR